MRTFNAVLAVAALSLGFGTLGQAQQVGITSGRVSVAAPAPAARLAPAVAPVPVVAPAVAPAPIVAPALAPVRGAAPVLAPITVSAPVLAPMAVSAPVEYSSSYVPPYSYYAADPYPARIYVGYGSNDFPFYGKPYGYPTDRWSWEAMSTNRFGGIARYYYPPVR